jgi:nitrous-oxide reductase
MGIKWGMLAKEAVNARTIASLFLGLVVGVGTFIWWLGPTLMAPPVTPFAKPYPMPHQYWYKNEEFYVFASGGQQGGVFVYGIPSMKLLAEIPAFTVDPAWGWTPEDPAIKKMLTNPWTGELAIYGDTHHTILSKTNGVYDGKWLFINDKLHPRLARIDLRTFRTAQVIWVPNIGGGIHGHHVSPNTDLVIGNFELEQYPDEVIINHLKSRDPNLAIDREEGPYVGGFAGVDVDKNGKMSNAWQVWGPWQHDMLRVGWGKSDGWIINTAYNTERANNTVAMFARKEDYVFFWKLSSIKKAVQDGNFVTTTQAPDVPVIAWKDVEVYAAKVPLNPHGIDISPTGKYILIGGKATTRVTAINFEKVLKAIQEKDFIGEEFGVKILNPNSVNEASMDIGLGPTHIEFDNKGFAYIGFFVDSDIKKVPLGEPYTNKHKMTPWQVVDTIPVHYSVGHLLVPGGDTAEPYGKYMISMNKLSKDTFVPHGPLRAENHELFNIEEIPAKLIDQMPIIPETHYSQAIPIEMVTSVAVYTLPTEIQNALNAKKFVGVEYDYDKKEVRVNMTAVRSFFTPDWFTVPEGWKVKITLVNVEQALDITHGLALEGHNILVAIDPGQVREIELTADKTGVFWYYCIWFCSELHLEMRGRMIVIPENEWSPDLEWKP